jgi:hypothetical protein
VVIAWRVAADCWDTRWAASCETAFASLPAGRVQKRPALPNLDTVKVSRVKLCREKFFPRGDRLSESWHITVHSQDNMS